MCFAIGAIVFDLQEEGALVTPHVVQHIGHKVTSEGDKVTLHEKRFPKVILQLLYTRRKEYVEMDQVHRVLKP